MPYSRWQVRESFEYLVALRESGATNMWGATPFLARALGIPMEQASAMLLVWIEVFKRDTPLEVVVDRGMEVIKGKHKT